MNESTPGTGGHRSGIWTLAVLFSIDVTVFMDRAALAAVLLPIERRFELSDTAAGFLIAAFSVSYCVALPVVGWLADRIPRPYVLAGGVGLWGLMSLATGLAQSWEQLLIARCLTGIGEATCAPLGPAVIADHFPPRQRNRALAFLFLAIPVGSALGYLVGAQATLWLDWRFAFFCSGALGVAAAGLALTLGEADQPPECPSDAISSFEAWKGLLGERRFVLTTIGMAFLVFALMGWNAWAPTFLTAVRGMSLDDAGMALGVIVALAGVGGATLGGWLGDRLHRRGPGATMALVAATTCMAVPCFAAALWAPSALLLLGGLGLGLTLVFFNVGPLDAVLISITSPRARGRALALNVLVIHLLGEMPAPWVVGIFSDLTGTLRSGLAFALAVLLIAGVLFWLAAGVLLLGFRQRGPRPTAHA
ncbi:MAG: MFS transporter [Planctomycetes bacterium]|nr:MFS transporter [Planctomycetota bacterium]